MINLFRLAYRNALRNGRRTALTAGTVVIGTAFTVVTLSLLGGIFDSMFGDWADAFGPVRVVTTEFAEKESIQPLHFNIPDSAPLLEKVRAIEGVALAAPMIRTGVLVAVGEELGEDPALMVGSTPAYYETYVLPNADLVAGSWLEPDAEGEQVVLGSRVARDIGAKVGDEILLMGTTQYGSMAPISADVVGVLSGNSTIDAQAYVTLETARWMVDVPDGALEIMVFPDSDDRGRIREVAASVSAALGDEYKVSAWMDRGLWAGNLPVMDGMRLIISSVVVFVMALAIFNTMTMSVLERTGEIGVMRAMGQSRTGAVVSFLAEAVVIGVLGGVLGALVGAGPALYLQAYGITYSQDIVDEIGADIPMTTTMTGELTAEVLMLAVFCGVLTAALGALFPAMRAANIQPYEAMRAKR